MRKWLMVLWLGMLCASAAAKNEGDYLYRISLVQAAPGKLLELIESYKSPTAALSEGGDEAPLWMRHSQGDHWDLLILWPIGSYSDYYSAARSEHRRKTPPSPARQNELIAWQEDLFCYGPPLADVRKAFAGGAYFHVEMFQALPSSLENAYAHTLNQPENFIFTRDQGAAWDIVTIGVFRDLKHYAASADATPEAQQAAARAAGFESPAQIGPYLRRFIRTHHDTLAVAIK